MKMRYNLIGLLLVALIACISAQADIILSDNFESDTVGTEPASSMWTGNNNSGTTTLNVSNDSVFGGSKYLAMVDDTASSGFWIQSAETFSSTLLTLSFDYYQPTVSGQSGDVSLGIGAGSTLGTLAHDIEFSAGKVEGQTVGLDGNYHIDVVMNNTGSTVSYGGVSLDSDYMDIWVDGSRIVAGQIAFANGRGIALTGFKFSTINPNVESLYIDNLEVRNEAYALVPEPVSVGMLGVGAFFLCAMRRVRSSR
jgi:hypothetical protein